MKSLRNKKGFTIVELVIVIAVIAILAAVLIPTFSGIVDKANDSKRLQTAKNAYSTWIADDDASNNTNALRQENVVGIKVTDNGKDYWFTVTNGVVKEKGEGDSNKVYGDSSKGQIIITASTDGSNVSEVSAESSTQ